MLRAVSTLLAVLAAVTACNGARAQDAGDLSARTPPPPVEPPRDPDTDLAELLYLQRVDDLDARLNEGWVLIGFGGASIATGAVLTALGADQRDDTVLWAGLGTMGWGAINALFSLFLMDVSGSVRADIDADRTARGADLVSAREDAARDQYNTGTIIAVNAGLDVFYVAAGLFLMALGDTADPGDFSYDGRNALVGYGAAMTAQGGGLLIYDVVTWLLAQGRGDRLMRMGR